MISKNNVQALIQNRNVTAYSIEKATGVSSSIITKLRNKVRSISNLSQGTMEKLSNYYMELYQPERIFWEKEDENRFLSWIHDVPREKSHIEVRHSVIYAQDKDGKLNVPYAESFPIDVNIEPFDSVTESLVDKYTEKYEAIQHQQHPDNARIPVPLQPFYSDFQEVSFIERDNMKLILQKIRNLLQDMQPNYADKLQQENEIALQRVMDGFMCDSATPEMNCYRGLLLTLEPIPILASPARY